MNPKHFEMRKIDYVVVSLALGHACKIIAQNSGMSLKQVREYLVDTGSRQAHSLTKDEADAIVTSYQECLFNPQENIQIKELIFFEANNN